MRRPRLKRTIKTLHTPEGDVRLLRPSAGDDVIVERPTAEQRELLRALDGRSRVPALKERFGEAEVEKTLSGLADLRLLEDAADDDLIPAEERERFDRQLRCFADFDGPAPSECQARLREAKVAILGVGGLGGWSAQALACSGVGEMRLVDGDRVEMSNLNRQILYTPADIGLLKAEIAAARLRAFNPAMQVVALARRLESEDDLADFIEGADVVIDTADWPAFEFERWCNAACFRAGIPYISMSHFSSVARVGPFFVPGQTGCYSCQEIALRRVYPLLDTVTSELQMNSGEAATFGAGCGLIGSQVALEVMHFLTGLVEPITLGTSLTYDLRTMEVHRAEILPEPECPVCSHLPRQQPSLTASAAIS